MHSGLSEAQHFPWVPEGSSQKEWLPDKELGQPPSPGDAHVDEKGSTRYLQGGESSRRYSTGKDTKRWNTVALFNIPDPETSSECLVPSNAYGREGVALN